jgi:hypothetical protein
LFKVLPWPIDKGSSLVPDEERISVHVLNRALRLEQNEINEWRDNGKQEENMK